MTSAAETWVFGYGSLIWRVDFPVEESRVGYIKNYARRFWQGSTDHRGVPGSPGRVVTLVPRDRWHRMANDLEEVHDDHFVTWGVAYRIHPDKVEEVKAHLDYREKGGYQVDLVPVYDKNSDEPIIEQAIVYIATSENENYLGPAPLSDIAKTISYSVGPSGHNREYLLELCAALRKIVPHHEDRHLIALERAVREMSQEEDEKVKALKK